MDTTPEHYSLDSRLSTLASRILKVVKIKCCATGPSSAFSPPLALIGQLLCSAEARRGRQGDAGTEVQRSPHTFATATVVAQTGHTHRTRLVGDGSRAEKDAFPRPADQAKDGSSGVASAGGERGRVPSRHRERYLPNAQAGGMNICTVQLSFPGLAVATDVVSD